MSSMISLAATALLAGSALGQQLTYPTLMDNLDALLPGMSANLPSTNATYTQWADGWIPADCKSMVESASLSAEDVTTYNVQYDDCSDPWILCYHNQSPSPFDDLVDLFGQLPVSMRSWVRHLIALPSPTGGHAYNWNGNIAMFDLLNNVDVFVHEAGHSLDLLGAYPVNGDDNTFHSSDEWLDNYAQDTDVPDYYAQTNMVEDVAQVTVVATFNINVPGGFGTVQPNYGPIFHQYATLQDQAGGYLIPGGTCGQRLNNSAAVSTTDSSRVKRHLMGRRADMPDVSLSDKVRVIDVSNVKEFHTGEYCKMTW